MVGKVFFFVRFLDVFSMIIERYLVIIFVICCGWFDLRFFWRVGGVIIVVVFILKDGLVN